MHAQPTPHTDNHEPVAALRRAIVLRLQHLRLHVEQLLELSHARFELWRVSEERRLLEHERLRCAL
jgi:hypothetical protein